MSDGLTRKQKEDYAKLLFMQGGLQQKEIAARVGVAEKTISGWKKENNWEALQGSLIITKEQELRRIYQQIIALNNVIESREEGKRFASPREADTLSKLSATARNLERETAVADIISVFKKFDDWLRAHNPKLLQEIIDPQDVFIKDCLNGY